MTEAKKVTKTKKSGVKSFKPGEIIFNENDQANSLYIIQRGQIRLFRPKGRGFVEIAILRSGEVIGEMAYFDENASRRSCSASAIVPTDVIEISFKAFSKTMSSLNPWFKTIIQTLADRLRVTNNKLKELESNSIEYKKGATGDYVFFHNIDIIRLFSSFYLAYKAHSEKVDQGHKLHFSVLKFYITDIYNILEVKVEEFIRMLHELKFVEIENDSDNLPKEIIVKDIYSFRSIMLFLNSQRLKEDHKKLRLSEKGLVLVRSIISHLAGTSAEDEYIEINMSEVFKSLESQKIEKEDYRELVQWGFAKELVLDEKNNLKGFVDYQGLRRVYPSLIVVNAVKELNEKKA